MAQADIENLKKTPLYSYYTRKGLKLTDFGGWALPIQFTKIQDEHHAVREKVGLFDVSHMGEIEVRGEKAVEWLNIIVTNDVSKMAINQAQYNTMVDDSGGTLDDLILFKIAEDHFWVTPNAANKDKILRWMNENNPSNDVELKDISDQYGLIAIQGPFAEKTVAKLTEADLESIKNYHFLYNQTVSGIDGVLISRTGYTGEDGFELYAKWDKMEELWIALVEAGQEEDIHECGLGARDTLRLEAGMALYGHELTEEISPLEGGLGFAVKIKKETDFIGQEALKQQKVAGLDRISRGFELTDRGIAREEYPVLNQSGETIGFVTSGTQSPTIGKSIGMMLIEKEFATFGNDVFIQVRKKQIPAKITKKDWLKRKREE